MFCGLFFVFLSVFLCRCVFVSYYFVFFYGSMCIFFILLVFCYLLCVSLGFVQCSDLCVCFISFRGFSYLSCCLFQCISWCFFIHLVFFCVSFSDSLRVCMFFSFSLYFVVFFFILCVFNVFFVNFVRCFVLIF